MKSHQISRLSLYNLVWKMPITRLAMEFNVSVNDIRNICRKHNIPLPENGYWSKLRHGKPVEITPLKEIEKEQPLIEIGLNPMPISTKGIIGQLVNEFEAEAKLPLQVSKKLLHPNPMVLNAKNEFQNKKEYFHIRGLLATDGSLPIYVSKEIINRALIFTDALIKLLNARGHKIEVYQGHTYFVVLGERINFQVQEKTRYIDKPDKKYAWESRDVVPTGILTFRMWIGFRFEQKIFGDGKQPVEELLSRILAWMEYWAEKKMQEDHESELRRQAEAEKLRIEKEKLARKNIELEKFNALLKASQRWKQTQILREYIVGYTEFLSKSKSTSKKEMKEWEKWANGKAEWFDPFICKEDELLGYFE